MFRLAKRFPLIVSARAAAAAGGPSRFRVQTLVRSIATTISRRPSSMNNTQSTFTRTLGVSLTMPKRFGGGRPEKSEFETRALEVLRGFDKIDADKLTLDSNFSKDLGLDSLDAVEVLMAIEDEFMIEIPDEVADEIHTVREAVEYVYDKWTPQHYM